MQPMKTDSIYYYSRAEELEHRARIEWGQMTDAERAEFARDRSGTKTERKQKGNWYGKYSII